MACASHEIPSVYHWLRNIPNNEVALPVSIGRNREIPIGETQQWYTFNDLLPQYRQPRQAGKFLQLDIGYKTVTQSASATM